MQRCTVKPGSLYDCLLPFSFVSYGQFRRIRVNVGLFISYRLLPSATVHSTMHL